MAVQVERKKQIERLSKTQFDCLIVGGGATGAGTAHDAQKEKISQQEPLVDLQN